MGPLLFLVYVDTLRFYLPGANFTAFADDTAMTIAEANFLDLAAHANDVLQYMDTFIILSFQSVNVSKTTCMTFNRTSVVINFLDSICFIGTIINQVFEMRYLGFFVSL